MTDAWLTIVAQARAHVALGTDPLGVVRLSVGPGTSDEDIECAAAALLALGSDWAQS